MADDLPPLQCRNVKIIRDLNLPGTPWATSVFCGRPLLFTLHGRLCVVIVVLLDRGRCVELITRPEESYRVWCVHECDHEAPYEEAMTRNRFAAPQKKNLIITAAFKGTFSIGIKYSIQYIRFGSKLLPSSVRAGSSLFPKRIYCVDYFHNNRKRFCNCC